VREGGHASGFRNGAEAPTDASNGGAQLYQVKGYGASSTYGAQVLCAARALNSGDCFILVAADGASVWVGEGANGAERETARALSAVLAPGRHVVEVEEGEEPESFWDALGGRGDYARGLGKAGGMDGEAPPRLFECSNRTGAFRAQEVCARVVCCVCATRQLTDRLTGLADLPDLNARLLID
jgi:hypothetical protein